MNARTLSVSILSSPCPSVFLSVRSVVILVWALLALAASARAGEPTKDQAVKNLKALQPQVAAQKQQGTLGEVHTGYLEALKPGTAAVDKLVADVNLNRRVFYAYVAQRNGISVEQAALNGGQRNLAEAAPGDWIKPQDGKWRKK
jgi:uncharacterized protein YdbL (DUF1318 family)